MKKYTTPEIKVSAIRNTDVITVSGGLVTGNFTKKDNAFKEISF